MNLLKEALETAHLNRRAGWDCTSKWIFRDLLELAFVNVTPEKWIEAMKQGMAAHSSLAAMAGLCREDQTYIIPYTTDEVKFFCLTNNIPLN